MTTFIDICADLGEGFGRYTLTNDDEMLEIVTSANIACGFHAGDPRTMFSAVQTAVKHGVGVGAHPSFPDLIGFGRRNMDLTEHEVLTDVLYQLGALDAFVKVHGGNMQHVLLHGQLDHLADQDPKYARAVVTAVQSYNPNLIILAAPGELARHALDQGCRVAMTIYADRAYNDDGTLVSRKIPGAVIHDVDVVCKRSVKMVTEGKVTTLSGREIPIHGDTLLVHGDTEGSAVLAGRIKVALAEAGVLIRPIGEWLS